MAKFLVSYDLLKPGQNYESLITRLRAYAAQKVLLSAWALSGNYTCAGIRDDLMRFIDQNDRLLVVRFDDNWAGYKILTDLNKV